MKGVKTLSKLLVSVFIITSINAYSQGVLGSRDNQKFIMNSLRTLSKGTYDSISVYINIPAPPRFPTATKEKEITKIYGPIILSIDKKLAYHYALLNKYYKTENVDKFQFSVDGQMAEKKFTPEEISFITQDVFSQIANLSKSTSTYVDVSITTKEAGAEVRYQTEFDRGQNTSPIQARNATNNCNESL